MTAGYMSAIYVVFKLLTYMPTVDSQQPTVTTVEIIQQSNELVTTVLCLLSPVEMPKESAHAGVCSLILIYFPMSIYVWLLILWQFCTICSASHCSYVAGQLSVWDGTKIISNLLLHVNISSAALFGSRSLKERAFDSFTQLICHLFLAVWK